MGSPLAPILANIFMCFNEEKWLNNCPSEFKPVLYRRYVDDTFLLFKKKEDIPLFQNYLNSQHPNIKFTAEIENNSKLAFLDIDISKSNNQFSTSVYRKETFTGLGLKYDSFVPSMYKDNLILTLLNRAYKICSNYNALHEEILKISKHLISNGFNLIRINRFVKKFMDSKFNNVNKIIIQTAPKCKLYFKLPYYGNLSIKLRKDLKILMRKYYPQINFQFVFTTGTTIASFFRHKERLPLHLNSSVVYKYTCSECNSEYIGKTIRQIQVRIDEHIGRSSRTHKILNNPSQSNIRNHANLQNHPIQNSNFKILTKGSKSNLNLLEAILIEKENPALNDHSSFTSLNIAK